MMYAFSLALLAHVLGDYVLQELLYHKVPKKHLSWKGMLLHSLYAEAVCGLVIGIITHHILASVVGHVLAHYMVDTIMPVRKTKLVSLFDQAAHIVCAVAIYYTLEVC